MGPACAYPDGFSIHAIHGVRVPPLKLLPLDQIDKAKGGVTEAFIPDKLAKMPYSEFKEFSKARESLLKKEGAAAARTRSRDWIVFRRTPTHRQGRHTGRNKTRLRRNRPRSARGMTRVRSTSSNVQSRMMMPAGSAIQRIEQAYRDDHRSPA